ncbi:MAG: DUF4112 domain-containing protein [Nocardioides sp.]
MSIDQTDLMLSRRLATLMDDLVQIPGTRIALGMDAVIGLVPGIGDLLGSTLSGVVVYDAVRVRVPVPILARMGWNLLVDALLGVVPMIGDLLDVAHRANRKNLRLLERALADQPDQPDRPEPTVGYIFAAVGLCLLPLLLAVGFAVVTTWLMLSWLVS